MKINANIINQYGVYFIEVCNKRTKSSHAYIINQEDVPEDYYNKEHIFKVIAVNRPMSGGYDNLHVVLRKNSDYFGLVGTNAGSIDSYKDLSKCDYLPCVVKLIK